MRWLESAGGRSPATPSPLLLDKDAFEVEVQVSEQEQAFWQKSGNDRAFFLVGCVLKKSRGARFWNASSAAKFLKPDISSVPETVLSCILYEFFCVFILDKTRCLELATNNLLTRTHSEIPSSLALKHSFSQDTIGEFPVSDPACPSKEMMSWVSPVLSIKILCFENIGSGLPGFTFLACYARTHARMYTYTHTQIRTHIRTHTWLHPHTSKQRYTGVRVCAWER